MHKVWYVLFEPTTTWEVWCLHSKQNGLHGMPGMLTTNRGTAHKWPGKQQGAHLYLLLFSGLLHQHPFLPHMMGSLISFDIFLVVREQVTRGIWSNINICLFILPWWSSITIVSNIVCSFAYVDQYTLQEKADGLWLTNDRRQTLATHHHLHLVCLFGCLGC